MLNAAEVVDREETLCDAAVVAINRHVGASASHESSRAAAAAHRLVLGRGAAPARRARDASAAIEALLADQGRLLLVLDDLDRYLDARREHSHEVAALLTHLHRRLQHRLSIVVTTIAAPETRGVAPETWLAGEFPTHARVHLDEDAVIDIARATRSPTGIGSLADVRSVFQQHASHLVRRSLCAETPTEEEFVALYPATAALLRRVVGITTRARVNAFAPGRPPDLMQLLAATRPRPPERPEHLLTLDAMYEPLEPWIDPEVRSVVDRAGAHARVTRTVALLALSETCVTTELVARALYRALGGPDIRRAVASALHAATSERLLIDDDGWSVRTASASAWIDERDRAPIADPEITDEIAAALAKLVNNVPMPRVAAAPASWTVLFADGSVAHDMVVLGSRTAQRALVLDARHLPEHRRGSDDWLRRSCGQAMRGRLVWIAGGERGPAQSVCRDVLRSRRMLLRAEASRHLPHGLRTRLEREHSRTDQLRAAAGAQLAEAFLAGHFYCHGHGRPARELGTRFEEALGAAAEWALGLTARATAP